MIITNKYGISKTELVEANNFIHENKTPKYHRMTDHNFYIKRYKRCIYCELGSKPLEDNLYYEYIKDIIK